MNRNHERVTVSNSTYCNLVQIDKTDPNITFDKVQIDLQLMFASIRDGSLLLSVYCWAKTRVVLTQDRTHECGMSHLYD